MGTAMISATVNTNLTKKRQQEKQTNKQANAS
jgi:hypothetical protein